MPEPDATRLSKPGSSCCAHCPGRHCGLCSVLTDGQLSALNGISNWKIFKAGQQIFKEGEQVLRCAIIINGVVKLTRAGANGQRYITGLLFAHDFLGRIFKPRHTWTAEAATEVELCLFPRDGFVRLLNRYPKLERQLCTAALNELDACRDWTVLLSQGSAYQRVAGFLYLMATRGGSQAGRNTDHSGKSARFMLPVRRCEIAVFLGVTSETVSRQMTLMKKEALISLTSRREVIIPDIERLGIAAAAEAGADEHVSV